MAQILETDRILLREFEIKDYKEVFEFGSDREVNKYTGDNPIESQEAAKELIKNVFLQDYKNIGFGRWASIYKPTNKIIGFAGLKYLEELDEVDIGFRFLPAYWGKGIATEVSKEIMNYGFQHLNINRIIGIADPKNMGSCKVLTKLGMKIYKTGKYKYTNDGILYNWYKRER